MLVPSSGTTTAVECLTGIYNEAFQSSALNDSVILVRCSMIHTFKFEPKFENGHTVLGKIPAGRIVESKPIFERGRAPYWLIVVDDEPAPVEPVITKLSNRPPD
jgi:hypothetical protein